MQSETRLLLCILFLSMARKAMFRTSLLFLVSFGKYHMHHISGLSVSKLTTLFWVQSVPRTSGRERSLSDIGMSTLHVVLFVLGGLLLAEPCSGTRILVANYPQILDPLTAHSIQMSKERGRSIEVAKSASLGSLAEEIRVDLGATANPIDKYDGYCLKTTWVPELAQDGLLVYHFLGRDCLH